MIIGYIENVRKAGTVKCYFHLLRVTSEKLHKYSQKRLIFNQMQQ